MRAQFSIVNVEDDKVTVRDECQSTGTMSVTNDAEAVVEHLVKLYPGRRIFYYDSYGMLDELAHDGEKFTGFKPGPGR